jgi:hypothetical protein
MAQIHRIAGGVAGLGGTLAARRTHDEASKDTFEQPSVLYGLGTGVAATALWGIDTAGILSLDQTLVNGTADFFTAHAASALPAGGASALLPKSGNSSGNGGSQSLSSFFNNTSGGASTVSTSRMSNGSSSDYMSANDYGEAQ